MTAFIPNGIKDFIWGLLPVFMIKYEEFQKKEKSHRLAAFFKEVYRNSGGKTLSKMSVIWEPQIYGKHELYKKQKEKLRLPLSYRQTQYNTCKNLKNFWAWKSACFLTHQIPFVSFPASFVLKPENPGNALMPIFPALAWFPQSLL